METNDNIIDLGEITLPTSWDEVTLKQYQEIERYYSDKERNFNILDVLGIFINKDKDYIMSLPSEFMDKILDKLSFMLTPIKETTPTPQIEIDGELYKVNTQNKLKVGEYIASETIIKNDPHNYAALLAILCRKEDEQYDSKFENEILEDRIELFEKQPITKILGIISFFLSCYMLSRIPTQLSLEVQNTINLIRSNIETSRKNGEISTLSIRSQMKKLKKLEKSIKSI